jgi:hypothetical protein
LSGETILPFMPAFLRHPEEAAIIGRLLTGYGELEYVMAMCLGAAMDDEHTAIRTLFRMKSERVTVANSLLFPLCDRFGLAGPYSAAIGGMRHCAKIRNLYAHSNWADDANSGLYFVDLIDTANGTNFVHKWLHTDVDLLRIQEDFFYNTLSWFNYIQGELALKKGRSHWNVIEQPSRLEQPLLHNPPEKHIPPWISLAVEDPPKDIPATPEA